MPNPKPKPLPTQERLQELFEYSVITGTLTRKIGVCGYSAGRSVGGKINTGYWMAGVDRTHYQAHRLIWRLVTGEDPGELDVDHIDGERTNNAWHNLRLGTRSQNASNQRLRSDNTSGLKGACWDPVNERWEVRLRFQKRSYFLGRFATAEEAHAAYVEAAQRLHGEFARAA
jgi:hypothetical protein